MLEGIRVLDVSGLVPGPYATLLLADLGAEVIKVETPLGDLARQSPPELAGHGAWFLSLNRNKQSIGLDLKKPGGRRLFLDLARRADVVVESFRPGRAERLGIGRDDLLGANPRLVYCALSGFGQTGPDSGRAGHDLTYLARSGALGLNARAGEPPVPPPVQIADLAGATNAAVGILAALVARERTGRGAVLDISMLESAMAWMGPHFAAHQAGMRAEAGEMPLAGRYPFYDVYRTADGGHVALAALEPLFWRDFCLAVEREDLVGLQFAAGAGRARLRAELEGLFAGRPSAEWAALFRARDLPAEVVAGVDAVLADGQLAARGALVSVAHPEPGGPALVLPACPVRALPPDVRPPRPPPHLGADTRRVLAEVLDLGPAEIDNLFALRVVFGPAEASPRRIAPLGLQ